MTMRSSLVDLDRRLSLSHILKLEKIDLTCSAKVVVERAPSLEVASSL